MSDQVTGLVHFGAREYDPEIGRWVERDPIGFAGGLNTHVYVGNSPTEGTDRTGLWRDDDPRIDRYNAAVARASDAERLGIVGMLGLAASPWAMKAVGALALEVGAFSEAAIAFGEVSAAEAGAGVGIGSGCAKASATAISRVRQKCAGGDCARLSTAPIEELGEGELISLLPKGGGTLPLVRDMPRAPWYLHAAVRLPSGEVLDPLLEATFASVDAWRSAVVGEADVWLAVGGAIIK